MDLLNKTRTVFFLFVISLLPASLAAQEGEAADVAEGESGSSRTCQDASVMSGRMIEDICWECMFPIFVFGVPLQEGTSSVPDEAANETLCACDGKEGLPEPGFGVGFWEPARLIETVKEPGCSPSLGGITLPGGDKRQWGEQKSQEKDDEDTAFYYYHYYAFPILLMLDLFVPEGCFTDAMQDFDLMYMSEVDPTWSDDQLAFFTNPEATAVANLPAQASCVVDAAATAVGEPIDSMFWCAGSWGSLYPLSGVAQTSSHPINTSLVSARALTGLHRRGLAQKTMGKEAMCETVLAPMLPKSQYKLSMFHPVPEADSSHVIGETFINWAFGRTVPVVGEDAVYVLFRWNDCCMKF